jgi:hypothetical protein
MQKQTQVLLEHDVSEWFNVFADYLSGSMCLLTTIAMTKWPTGTYEFPFPASCPTSDHSSKYYGYHITPERKHGQPTAGWINPVELHTHSHPVFVFYYVLCSQISWSWPPCMEEKYVAVRVVVVVCLENTLTRTSNLHYEHVGPSFRAWGIFDTYVVWMLTVFPSSSDQLSLQRQEFLRHTFRRNFGISKTNLCDINIMVQLLLLETCRKN